jgi:hypothetical protein
MSEQLTPTTVAATLEHIDAAWHEFRAVVSALPVERLDEPLADGWTRKQMLAHISAWHDYASDRLSVLQQTGEKRSLAEGVDEINARVARAAAGRTAGEVLEALEGSFRRLQRQVGHLSDQQLMAHDGWPAEVIAENTYRHYAEHVVDLQSVEE